MEDLREEIEHEFGQNEDIIITDKSMQITEIEKLSLSHAFVMGVYKFVIHYQKQMSLLVLLGMAMGAFVNLHSTEQVLESYNWWHIPSWTILLVFYFGLLIIILFISRNFRHSIESHLLSFVTSIISLFPVVIGIISGLLRNILNDIDVQQLSLLKLLQDTIVVLGVMGNVIGCIVYSIGYSIMDTFTSVDTTYCNYVVLEKVLKANH